MNNVVRANLFRFIGLVLMQGLVFQNIGTTWEGFPYLHIIVFPVFILLLPLRAPVPLIILLGFATGMAVDAFYGSYGVHASAAVFTAFARPGIIKLLEPRGGYNINFSPTIERMGIGWFIRYAAVLMFLHLFFYFSVEAFTFVYFTDILLKTIVSYLVSMTFVIIYQVLFNPME